MNKIIHTHTHTHTHTRCKHEQTTLSANIIKNEAFGLVDMFLDGEVLQRWCMAEGMMAI